MFPRLFVISEWILGLFYQDLGITGRRVLRLPIPYGREPWVVRGAALLTGRDRFFCCNRFGVDP